MSSLEKLKRERREAAVYGEAVATMESLAVLKAWAEVWMVWEVEREDGRPGEEKDIWQGQLLHLH